jgi:hypothetical protein
MTDHSSRRFDGDAADAAIDRAVREIMSTDTAPRFRQRVLARLEDRSGDVWAWGRLGFVASAAAMVVVLAIWMRTERRPEAPVATKPPAVAAQRPEQPTPPPSASPATPAPGPARRAPGAVARRSAPAPSERRVTAASVAAVEEALERGATTNARPADDATVVPPLQIRPLEVPEIMVKPVTIGPIVVVPLLPPRR